MKPTSFRLPVTGLFATICTLIALGVSAWMPALAQSAGHAAGIIAGREVPQVSAEEMAAPANAVAVSPADRALAARQQEYVRSHRISMVDDWMSHVLVFPNVGTEAEALSNGKHEQWKRITTDPRYVMQQIRRGLPAQGMGPEALEYVEHGLAAQSAIESGSPITESRSATVRAQWAKIMATAAGSNSGLQRDWNLSLGRAGVAAGMFPAGFVNSNYDPSCTQDYIVFPVNASGSSSQAMIVGVNNLYTFCNSGTPTVAFAYYYSTGGTIQTSPETSLDGTKVAFIESLSTGSKLHILQVGVQGAGYVLNLYSGGTATAPILQPANGTSSTGSTDVTINLNGSPMVTRSSAGVDYFTDQAVVGDDNGVLHMISPVFTGTSANPPREVIGGGGTNPWPITVDSGIALSSPTFDADSENAYVGDANGKIWYVRTANPADAVGTCYNGGAGGGTPPCLGGYASAACGGSYCASIAIGDKTGSGGAFGIVTDPPIVDAYNNRVLFATGASYQSAYCSTAQQAMVYEISRAYAPASAVDTCIGAANKANLHLGAFDYLFYIAGSSCTGSACGHFYQTAEDATYNTPALWTLSLNSSDAITGAAEAANLNALGASTMEASPLTTIYDNHTGNDWLNLSVPTNSCGGSGVGCLFSFNINNGVAANTFGPWLPSWPNFMQNSEILDTNGNLEKASCGASPSSLCPTSGSIGPTGTTPPAWPASSGGTVSEGTTVEASGTGTFSTNTATGGQTVSVDGVTLTAATPTSAMGTGTFTADPSPTAGTIKITNAAGSTTATFTPSPSTAGMATGTFTTDPTSGSVTITQPSASSVCTSPPCSMTLTVSPGTAATGSGTFTGSPSTGEVTITNGANVLTLNANPLAAASATGTFSGVPTNGQTATIGGSEVLTASAETFASGTGTFSGNPNLGTTITITNGGSSETLTPSAGTAATATGAFTGTPANGQAVTITNGGNIAILKATSTTGTMASNSFTFATNVYYSEYSLYQLCCSIYPGLDAGDVAWWFESATGSVCYEGTYYCRTTDYSARNAQNYSTILIGDTEAHTVANVVAALNNNQTLCGYKDPTSTDNGYNTCFHNGTVLDNGAGALPPQNFMTASASAGTTVILTANIGGTGGNCSGTCWTSYGWESNSLRVYGSAYEDFSPTSGGLSGGSSSGGGNSCSPPATATFLTNANLATEASNLAAAINACPSSLGVTATAAGTAVNLAATNGGTAGNSIALQTYSTPPAIASGSFTVSEPYYDEYYIDTVYGANYYPGIDAGNVIWWIECASGSATLDGCYTTDYSTRNAAGYSTILIGTTTAQTAQNYVAAINNNQALCGYKDPTSTDNGYNTCFHNGTVLDNGLGALPPQNYVTASVSGTTVTLTANAAGTSGNCAGTCWTTYGWEGNSYRTESYSYEDISPATGGLSGGAAGSGAATGFSWTASTGTPPCNGGGNNPCDMGGGTAGVTSATTYAIDGVPADDATQLAAAINTSPNPANVKVTATSSGAVVTVTASTAGSTGNSIALGGTANNFAWSGSTLTGGNNVQNSGTYFAITNSSGANLTTTQIASNFATAVSNNGGTVGVSATNSSNVDTVTATTAGSGGNGISLASTLSNFAWSGSTLTGGSGLNAGNYFATQTGNTTANATNLAAAINRYTSGTIPVTATSSGATVTVTSQTRGTAANSIQLGTSTSAYAMGNFTMTALPSSLCTTTSNNEILIGYQNYYYEFANSSCYPSEYGALTETMVYIGSTIAQTVQNFAAAINNAGQSACGQLYTGGGTGNNTCYNIGSNTQNYATAIASGNTIYLTAKANGTAGNCTAGTSWPGSCYTTYGWTVNYSTDTEISPIFGGLTGGVNGSVVDLAGFGWSPTPTDPVNLTGGTNGVTNASMFATDGVLADDAANLATAIGLGNTAHNVGVTATQSGAVVTVAGNPRGPVDNNITLANALPSGDFAWSSSTLTGGANGTTNATMFAIDGNANDDAVQLAAAINTSPNPTNLGLSATATGSGVVKLTETLPGTTGNAVALSTTATVSATGTFTFTAQPGSYCSGINSGVYSYIEIGGLEFWFASTSDTSDSPNCYVYWNNTYASGYVGILIGDTLAHTAQNLAAAINKNQAMCGYTDPNTSDGSLYGTCYAYTGAVNTYVTGSSSSTSVTLTSKVTGTGGNGTGSCYTNYGWDDIYTGTGGYGAYISAVSGCNAGGSSNGSLSNFAWCGTTLGGCTPGANGTTTGTTFQIWSGNAELTAAQIATQFAAMVNTSGNGLSNLITAGASGSAVTLTAKTCGPGGDYSTVNNNLSGFSFSGGALTGGACALTWTNQGAGNGQAVLGVTTGTSGILSDALDYPNWTANTAYGLGTQVTDSNGNNQYVIKAGTSGSSAPSWNATTGGDTTDGTVTWLNQGPSAPANLYFGTLTGTGGNKAEKVTAKGLQ